MKVPFYYLSKPRNSVSYIDKVSPHLLLQLTSRYSADIFLLFEVETGIFCYLSIPYSIVQTGTLYRILFPYRIILTAKIIFYLNVRKKSELFYSIH